MKIYYGLRDKKIKSGRRALAIGVFDGVHRGHRRILNRAALEAKKLNAKLMVVTFDPHPAKVLDPGNAPPVLMSLKHRLKLLEELGCQEVLVVAFNKQFAKTSHRFFLDQILIHQLGMRALSVGHDFCFGHQGLGNQDFLRSEAKKKSFSLYTAKALRFRGEVISSTAIRRGIERGKLAKAEQMLGRPFSLYGTVVAGRGRGKSLGFPTANVDAHHESLPPDGVYAVWGIVDGIWLKGVLHIGPKPTFKENERSIEVHFPGYKKNLYGKEIELVFAAKIRKNRSFSSPKALIKRIQLDICKSFKLLQ